VRIFLLLFLSCFAIEREHYYEHQSEVYPAIVLSKPVQKGKWQTKPNVRICPDTGISPARVSRAMNYWKRLGYEFGNIIIEKDMYNCLMPPPLRREILITLPHQEFNEKHLAATKISTHRITGEIVKANIYITPRNSERERILEHEFGHALGWNHYPQRDHIMNPEWEFGGYNSYGLRR